MTPPDVKQTASVRRWKACSQRRLSTRMDANLTLVRHVVARCAGRNKRGRIRRGGYSRLGISSKASVRKWRGMVGRSVVVAIVIVLKRS